MVTPFDRTRPNYDAHEFFADEFACALLMPIEDIYWRAANGWNVIQMQKLYGVPLEALRSWLRRLDKHPPEGATRRQRRKLRELIDDPYRYARLKSNPTAL